MSFVLYEIIFITCRSFQFNIALGDEHVFTCSVDFSYFSFTLDNNGFVSNKF